MIGGDQTMSNPTVYQIRVNNHLGDEWVASFAPLVIHNEPNGQATLTGLVRDQAQLVGILLRLHDLNILLVSVNRIKPGETPG
jgi:hypothetical protein